MLVVLLALMVKVGGAVLEEALQPRADERVRVDLILLPSFEWREMMMNPDHRDQTQAELYVVYLFAEWLSLS